MASTAEEFTIGPWRISTNKSHILKSRCEKGEGEECPRHDTTPCAYCKYSRELELSSLPEMVFPDNKVTLQNTATGVGIEFNALDALKMVDSTKETLSVAASKEWLALRSAGLKEVKEKVKPFDWTFSTAYQGTMTSKNTEKQIKEEGSGVGINYDKLKVQEKILFYDDIVLFEDELADNGIAILRVKMRVMASGFFILQRFFLRVDDVLIRINDTRLYHEAGSDHIKKEYSVREANLPDPSLPLELIKDINTVSEYLTHNRVITTKLILPK